MAMGKILARGLWRWRYGVPFLHPENGELRTVDRARPSHQDSFYDILLLGGSTLHPDWGRVEAELRDQLAGHGRKNVRIFNLAQPAHSSRDSLLKYAAVGDSQFRDGHRLRRPQDPLWARGAKCDPVRAQYRDDRHTSVGTPWTIFSS
jgi:hypothetical protein